MPSMEAIGKSKGIFLEETDRHNDSSDGQFSKTKRSFGKRGRTQKRNINRSMARNRNGDEKRIKRPKTGNNSEKIKLESGSNDELDNSELEESDVDENEENLDSNAYGSLIKDLQMEYSDEDEENGEEIGEEVDVTDGEADALNGEEENKQVGREEEEDQEEEEENLSDGDSEALETHFDALDKHFNEEDKIGNLVSSYEARIKKEGPRGFLKVADRQTFKEDGYVKVDMQYQGLEHDYNDNHGEKQDLDNILEHYNVRKNVQKEILKTKHTDLEVSLMDSLLKYQNVQLQYYHSIDIRKSYQKCYLLHCLNHVLKTRNRVLNNNQKKKKIMGQIDEGKIDPSEADKPQFRDQGYTRPRVLILLPTRNAAWETVNKLVDLSGIQAVESKKRFRDQFYDSFGRGNTPSELSYKRKPADFREMFKGNSNDYFCLGVKLTRKSIRLYAKLDQSDIIIASPLGLKMIYEKSANSKGGRKGKKEDTEFLSSIEISVLDKCEGLLMQNWELVTEILEKRLNAPAKNFEEFKVDFSRIRMWAINDQYKFVTQMLVFGKYGTPELNSAIMNSKISSNLQSGTAIYKPSIDQGNCVIDSFKEKMARVGIIGKYTKLSQAFMRFDSNTIVSEPDKRFAFFKNVMLPQITNKASYDFGTLIYVPNYIDYLRLTNYLRTDSSVPFVSIDEYSSQGKVTRNRAKFADARNDARVMVMTERLHFYKRYSIKGVRNVIFYDIPTDPDFYSQILQFVVDEKIRVEVSVGDDDDDDDDDEPENEDEEDEEDDENEAEEEEENEEDNNDNHVEMDLNLCMIRSMFSRFDLMRLEKVVGLRNAARLCKEDSEVNVFN